MNESGFLIINKEKGISSFDEIRKLRKKLGRIKMGHLGTLDPLATGVLVIAVNKATKLVEFLMGEDKEYEVEAVFGGISDTYDAEGKIIYKMERFVLYKKNIEKALKSFRGEILQIPPSYCALKIKGQPAYKRVRRGEKVELKPRKVTIFSFKLLSLIKEDILAGLSFLHMRESNCYIAKFKIKCSSGTYIRSLIHDFGNKLKVGAYVNELQRLRVGDFKFKDSIKVSCLNKTKMDKKLIPLISPLKKFHRINLTEDEMQNITFGRQISNRTKNQDGDFVLGLYNHELKSVLKVIDGNLKIVKNI